MTSSVDSDCLVARLTLGAVTQTFVVTEQKKAFCQGIFQMHGQNHRVDSHLEQSWGVACDEDGAGAALCYRQHTAVKL